MQKLFKTLKCALVIIYIISLIIIGFYRYPNQDITIKIRTDNESREYWLSVSEIGEFYKEDIGEDVQNELITEYVVDFEGIGGQDISEIDFYRKFKSVCVGKISSSEMWQYVYTNENEVVFNQAACNMIRNTSESFLMERLIYAEYVLVIIMFMWIIISALSEKFDVNNLTNHGPIYEIKRFKNELIKYREYIFYAAKADLNAEVANSYLNRLWWILEPFFNMLVYVIVFGRIMGNSVQSYSTFVFSALIMWNYFNHIINYSVKCVRYNRDIVSKIYMPKYILLLTNMVLNFIKLMFSAIVLIILLFVFQIHIGINVLWIVPAYLLMVILSFGVGMIFLHYGVFIDDLAYAVGILLTMLMFLSGVFYDVLETLPSPLNGILLCINPVATFIDTMRNAIFNNALANLPIIVCWILIGIQIMYIGLHIVYKNENSYVKVI